MRKLLPAILCAALLGTLARAATAQTLEQRLASEGKAALARAARAEGDARRGAVVFHQPALACAKCHVVAEASQRLGPDLTRPPDQDVSDEHLVESILEPSRAIRQGYETVTVQTKSGQVWTGLLLEESEDRLILRDGLGEEHLRRVDKADVEERSAGRLSIMPAGQVNQLAGRQEFLDLVRYLMEIRDGGPLRARELEPPASLFVLKLPDYEARVDHAGLIRAWDEDSVRRGEAIYQRLCINCHGTREHLGSLPTSLRFASGKFRNGHDPYSIYQTLTRGFGLMAPQTWMVPRQKYDVIAYLRKAYLETHNPSQHATVDESYLAALPHGDTHGPEPVTLEPWATMDYGPSLINTYEISGPSAAAGDSGAGDGSPAGAPPNLAYKGIAVRLDMGPGGIARGGQWMVFDHDTLRVAGAWSGRGFIDWNGIQFNGAHGVHPHVVGVVHMANPVGPGWADPRSGSFADPRFRGRDGRPYGPLPRAWGKFQGLFHHSRHVVLAYTVGETDVLELPGLVEETPDPGASAAHSGDGPAAPPVFLRTFEMGPRRREMVLQVARHPDPAARLAVTSHRADPLSWSAATLSSANAGLHARIEPAIASAAWRIDRRGGLLLRLPPGEERLRFTLAVSGDEAPGRIPPVPASLDELTRGGPARWPERLTTDVETGTEDGPFAVETLAHPADNPWGCQMRFTGLDFLPDGDRLAVCAWDGDVWLVSGLSGLGHTAGRATQAPRLTWQRIASGLFQPLGLKIVGEAIHVSCRDQIVVLRDLNGDGETDFYECFNNDHQVTEHFHEFAMGLQTDRDGNFYYAKSARHALTAIVPQHGTLLRVSQDGAQTDILATGFRAANGVCLNPDGSFIVTDQEGHWNPKNRINRVVPGGFYGNMFGYHDVTDSADSAMRQPVCWITNAFDRSPAELLWVDSDAWGPLRGALLNLSYGTGRIFVVPHETVQAQPQGGMCPLPIDPRPTGILRGRFHPGDGQLYTCGMFAWAGNATQPGGLYRVRCTGRPVHVPLTFHARRGKLEFRLSGRIDAATAREARNYAVRVWSLRRTENYGSDHFDERRLTIRAASVGEDGATLTLEIPDLAPTWCIEVRYALRTEEGQPLEGVLHGTIHHLN